MGRLSQDDGSCTNCYGNEYVDTNGVWVQWPEGFSYFGSLKRWVDWETSWNELWAYRQEWFEWGAHEYLDLGVMQWASEWDAQSQVAIEDEQIGGRRVWRDLEYFVDSGSEEVVELGTKQYPYKDFGYVFVELLNFHSHSERNITVYLKENTESKLYLGNNYIANITEVRILTYSANSSATPGQATIVAYDEYDLQLKHGTSFNILSHFNLKIAENVDDNTEITSLEKQRINSFDILIIIIRSNFYIQGVDLKSDYESVTRNSLFFFPVYLQDKKVTIMDAHIGISGTIMLAFDPMGTHLENIDVDYYRNSGGFSQQMY